MGHGMDRRVGVRPAFNGRLHVSGQVLEGSQRLGTMLANKTALHDVAAEKRQERRPAAGRGREVGRGRGQPHEPNLAAMAHFGRQAVSADEGMREAPDPAAQLPKRLGQPARQRGVVEAFEDRTVFGPEAVR